MFGLMMKFSRNTFKRKLFSFRFLEFGEALDLKSVMLVHLPNQLYSNGFGAPQPIKFQGLESFPILASYPKVSMLI